MKILLIAALAGVLGFGTGTVTHLGPTSSCVLALSRADQLMDDLASFGKSSLTGISTVMVGGKYNSATDPNYLKAMAEVQPYKVASANCRGGG